MAEKTEGNAPMMSMRDGSISVSVWEKAMQTKEGKPFVGHSIKVVRKYREKDDGEWKETSYFNKNDLPRLQNLLAYVSMKLVEGSV